MRLVPIVVIACGCRGTSNDRDRAPAPPPPAKHCTPNQHACDGDDVIECTAAGSPGSVVQHCKDGCRGGTCSDPCATQGVELIYLVDNENHLMSFDPSRLATDPFHTVGTLACSTPEHHPFSMAVDRRGIAWVLYENGELYRVSILDGHCAPAGRATGSDVPERYGMGFATDGSSTTETLYVGASDSRQRLARLDVTKSPPTWTPIGPIPIAQDDSPELTGTGDGALFGYFPRAKPGFVQELDPRTGALVGERHAVPLDGRIQSWAVAHSAGMIYEFVTVDGNSQIHSVRRKTGEHALVREHLPMRIVGAGVSTCAPELERASP